MREKHKEVDVRISRRTLWVGMQAYPLQMVTRVEPIEVVPDRRRMLLRYARRAGATLGLGVVALILLGCLGESAPRGAYGIAAAVFFGVLAVHTVQLVRGLTRASLYVLSVGTAGTARAALRSTNRDLIYDLAIRVVEAIDNPSAEYEIRVDHIEIVHGDKYEGDRVERDKIEWT